MGDYDKGKPDDQGGKEDKNPQSDQGGKPAFSQMGEDKQEQFDEVEGQDFEKGEIQGNDMGKPGADDGSLPQKGQEEFAGTDKVGQTDDSGSKG